MNANNLIVEAINDNLKKNSNFEFIVELKDLTLSDIDSIEAIVTINNINSKLDYQIVDNIYIKIDYSL